MNKIPLFSLKGVEYKCHNGNTLTVKKFEIHKGIVYGISGKPGAGKTVLLDILAKKIKPSSGEIEYDGKAYSQLSSKDYKNQFAIVPQTFKTPFFATVRDYLLKTFSNYSHIDSAQKRLEAICRKMDISESILDLKMKYLSPGQLRWVLLACGVGADTKVLLIDEIEQHLPAEQLTTLLKVLHKKCNYDGVTMIISTQKIDVLKKIGSIFVSLDEGKITSVRSPNRKPGRRPNRPQNKDRKKFTTTTNTTTNNNKPQPAPVSKPDASQS
jgi:ABC-type multidrug transport system ATPase subunit